MIISLFFYLNIQPAYTIVLILVSLVTYVFGLLIDKQKSDKKKEYLLTIGIILILSPLFFFKYYNFVNESISFILENFGVKFELMEIGLLLPIGISFYTFMAIGYVIDVYNEEIRAENNLGLITLFLSFFPLVLSGPIERANSMLTQFKGGLEFDYHRAVKGFQFMLWGYFMKLVIADRIAIYTDAVFGNVDQYSGSTNFLASLLLPLQVYGDLGGYSLMAIGAANIFGVKIRPNFNRPFFATSISEFWRKWHMSLITWITDYLYTPISFSLRKYKIWGIVLALFITFLIAGVWHGATIAFIVWGVVQGILVSIEALTKKNKNNFENKYQLTKKRWYVLLSILFTYLLISFSFLFGVAVDTLSESMLVINKIFTDTNPIYIDKISLGYGFIGLSMLFISEFRDEYFPKKLLLFKNENIYIRWTSYAIILVLILLIGVFEGGEFIYFKF